MAPEPLRPPESGRHRLSGTRLALEREQAGSLPGPTARYFAIRQEDIMLQKVLSPACVWMRAGVIRFWLCDRDFDCDNCPLDAALRAHRSARPEEPVLPTTAPADALPHADRRHHRR